MSKKIFKIKNKLQTDLNELDSKEILLRINKNDANIHKIVCSVIPEINRLVLCIIDKIKLGGRLFYVGCGTSGRLGMLDAVECPPTFSTDPSLIQALIAGGKGAFFRAVEGAEDSFEGGKKEIKKKEIYKNDVIVGISASGSAAFVKGALEQAKELGSSTAIITCRKVSINVDYKIEANTGPEIILGSTRMKAGTVTKMILNMISTSVMIKLNRTYSNYMVNLKTSNKKLKNRAINMILSITNISKDEANKILLKSKGNVEVAILMIENNLSYAKALELYKDKFTSLKSKLDVK